MSETWTISNFLSDNMHHKLVPDIDFTNQLLIPESKNARGDSGERTRPDCHDDAKDGVRVLLQRGQGDHVRLDVVQQACGPVLQLHRSETGFGHSFWLDLGACKKWHQRKQGALNSGNKCIRTRLVRQS